MLKADIEVVADEAFEVGVIERRGDVGCQDLLDCAADVLGGIDKSAVYVEEVDRELRERADYQSAPHRIVPQSCSRQTSPN